MADPLVPSATGNSAGIRVSRPDLSEPRLRLALVRRFYRFSCRAGATGRHRNGPGSLPTRSSDVLAVPLVGRCQLGRSRRSAVQWSAVEQSWLWRSSRGWSAKPDGRFQRPTVTGRSAAARPAVRHHGQRPERLARAETRRQTVRTVSVDWRRPSARPSRSDRPARCSRPPAIQRYQRQAVACRGTAATA